MKGENNETKGGGGNTMSTNETISKKIRVRVCDWNTHTPTHERAVFVPAQDMPRFSSRLVHNKCDE